MCVCVPVWVVNVASNELAIRRRFLYTPVQKASMLIAQNAQTNRNINFLPQMGG